VPWRRAGVKYANNEAYFDVIEEIDAIIDKSGGLVTCEVQGYVSIELCYYTAFSWTLLHRMVLTLSLLVSYHNQVCKCLVTYVKLY